MQKLFALGPRGTNGHEAAKIARETLPSRYETEISFVPSNYDILEKAKRNKAFGIVPIENSSAGLVDVIRDFWCAGKAEETLHVIGKIRLAIEHNLLVRRGQNIKNIEEVISHPQALAQCSTYLQKLGISLIIPTLSTAAAAEHVANDQFLQNTAAIASRFAAEVYGLDIAKKNIENTSGNVTFFYLVGPNPAPPTGDDQTAIIFRIPNRKGALIRILTAISLYGESNMSSIHSIPLGSPHQYSFYCEFDGHRDSEPCNRILSLIRDFADELVILGSFPTPNHLNSAV